MRITHETLLKVVRDTVNQRIRSNRGLIAAYLCGSLLDDDYLLGGTTDIDLVLIHTDQPEVEREVVHLTDDIHLDISHHLHRDYRQTRKLRVHPWLGPSLKRCQILHDPQHFMDFTQASVRGQFDRSDYVMERARIQAEHARQMWLGFHEQRPTGGPKEMVIYLRALDHAVNAIASLNGFPLTERRLLARFPQRAQALRRPILYAGLMGLLGATNIDAQVVKSWIPGWAAAYDAVPAQLGLARLHPVRKLYYQRSIEALLADLNQPLAALWPLLRTWTLAINALPPDHPALEDWRAAFRRLGLLENGFSERLEAMDAYLDQVEEALEQWAQENGA